MPKKTRQEKIIAELRRKLETTKAQGLETTPIMTKPAEEKKVSSDYRLPDRPVSSPKTQVLTLQSTTDIMRDLKKTFFLTGLAISFEVIVYWLTELGGSKLFKFLPIK